MVKSENKQNLLRKLPAVDNIFEMVKKHHDYANVPKSVLVNSIRKAIEDVRIEILEGVRNTDENRQAEDMMTDQVIKKVRKNITEAMTPNLRRMVNAAGVIVYRILIIPYMCSVCCAYFLQYPSAFCHYIGNPEGTSDLHQFTP